MAKIYSYIKIILFIIAEIYIFRNFGKFYGFIGLGILLYRCLQSLGIIRSPKIFRGSFLEGVAYLKDYKGSYRNKAAFEEAVELIKKYDLKKFTVIGVYYDRPNEVKESEFRYSIGVFRKNVGFPEPVPIQFDDFCQKNNYYSVQFPVATSIYSTWEYSNKFSMAIGIMKFYKSMQKNMADDYFKKMYRVNDKTKTTIEIYTDDSKIEFYIPLFSQEQFFVYRKEDKPKNE